MTTTDIVKVDAKRIADGEPVEIRSFDGKSIQTTTATVAYNMIPGLKAANATMLEVAFYLQWCASNMLDPFRGQCFFVRYGANDPPQFVVSYQVFLARAGTCPAYDGYESGIVWRVHTAGTSTEDDVWKMVRGAPCDYVPDDEHIIFGGWCLVYRKDRSRPVSVEVPLSEMQGTKWGEERGVRVANQTWSTKTTSMSEKTVVSRGHRRAFPDDLGQLYTQGEIVAEPTPEAVEVATREVRAETVTLGLGDVAAALDGLIVDTPHSAMIMADMLPKLAHRATGIDAAEFADDSAWTHEICEDSIADLAENGIDPEWLPGEEVPSE